MGPATFSQEAYPQNSYVVLISGMAIVTKHHQLNSLERQNFTLSRAGSTSQKSWGQLHRALSVSQLRQALGAPELLDLQRHRFLRLAFVVARLSSLCVSVSHLLL